MMRRLLGLASVFAMISLAAVGCAAPQADAPDDGSADGTDVGMNEGASADNGNEGTTSAALSKKASVSTGACPTNGRVSQGFSSRHDGIDLANARGTAIYAAAAGTVAISGPAQGYGQWIRIKHDDGSMTEYGHMDTRLVKTGARVAAGQKIALMGSQGDSTGPHLHLRTYRSAGSVGEGRGMNPVDYMRARGITLPCKPGVAAPLASADSADTTPSDTTASSSSGTTVSVWKDAEVMESPTTNGAFVVQAAEDTTYAATCWTTGEEISSDGYTNEKWVKITVNGQTGWISGIFLRGDKTGGVTSECSAN